MVNSSPSLLLTDQLGLPTIGFCPMETGRAAARYFSNILKHPGLRLPPLSIPPKGNAAFLKSVCPK